MLRVDWRRSVKTTNVSFLGRTINFNMENISLDMLFRILYCIEYWNHNPKHYGVHSRASSLVVVLHDDAYSYISELVMICYRIRQDVPSFIVRDT